MTLLDIDEIDLMEMYTYAHQRPFQGLRGFQSYLCAIETELERHFKPRSQKERSIIFVVKLDPDLQYDIRQYLLPGKLQLPEELPKMVKLASDKWRARNPVSEIMGRSGCGKGSGSSRRNHRGRLRSSKIRRDCGNSNK